MAEFTVKCPVIVCTQTPHETKSHGNKCRKPILSGPLESDIGPVRDMSEIATENKVYSDFLPFSSRPSTSSVPRSIFLRWMNGLYTRCLLYLTHIWETPLP